MIAYNKEWLNNLVIQEQCQQALDNNCVGKSELEAIRAKYPVGFYTPNFFIRIGLFLLTVIIITFSFGLLGLILISAIEKSITGLAIFFALVTYAALEMMVQSKHHYRAGTNEALLWISAGTLFAAISDATNAGGLANCVLLFVIAGYCTARFADILSSIVAFGAGLGILFFTCVQMGPLAKAFVPFVIMIAAGITYFLVKKCQRQKTFIHYSACLLLIEITALIVLYTAGNYFVVRELSISLFDLQLADGQSIPFGWLFWCFTFAIPAVYLFFGIKNKDQILIRIGLLLVAAMVFTFRNYYSAAPVEVAMTIGGVVLILVSYILIRYLKTPKHGFTYEASRDEDDFGASQAEAVIISETFVSTPAAEPATKFGGGSFGGAGAGGDF